MPPLPDPARSLAEEPPRSLESFPPPESYDEAQQQKAWPLPDLGGENVKPKPSGAALSSLAQRPPSTLARQGSRYGNVVRAVQGLKTSQTLSGQHTQGPQPPQPSATQETAPHLPSPTTKGFRPTSLSFATPQYASNEAAGRMIDTNPRSPADRKLSEAISPGTALTGQGSMATSERQRQKSAVRDPAQRPRQLRSSTPADQPSGNTDSTPPPATDKRAEDTQPEQPPKRVSFKRSQNVVHEYQKIVQSNEMSSFLGRRTYWGLNPILGRRRKQRRREGRGSSPEESSASASE